MKISHYSTTHADNVMALDEQVYKLAGEGYEPYGSPYLSDRQIEGRVDTLMICQAMIKPREAGEPSQSQPSAPRAKVGFPTKALKASTGSENCSAPEAGLAMTSDFTPKAEPTTTNNNRLMIKIHVQRLRA